MLGLINGALLLGGYLGGQIGCCVGIDFYVA